ncbi:hypothetical protein [Mycolicibacterium porcinum]|uniref:hypothetical protein n=1 Tax=Mycolicibacterium porcinum TaxID=39693 RepID=UPI0010426974|nr:hypothetical protein [Mycolicibacterium porcinum]
MSIWAPESWSGPVDNPTHPASLLDGSNAEAIIQAVEAWAKDHPLHDRPLLYIGQESGGLTPDDIAAAVRNRHHPARHFVARLFEVGLSGYRGSQEDFAGQFIDALHGKTPR